MKFQLYHAIKPTFGMTNPKFPDDYKLVAEVEADHFSSVYHKTQNIEESWIHNEGVRLKVQLGAEEGPRSTSVGDVIVTPEGKKLRYEPVGFTEL